MAAADRSQPPARQARLLRALVVAAVLALAASLYGGYVLGWKWTGFGPNAHLWDWLNLLVLPIAFATLPIWLRAHHLLDARRRRAVAGTVLAFAGVVAAGYLVPWVWTGFTGNTLWDWLSLLLLPVVITTMAFWRERERVFGLHHHAVAAILVLALAIAAAGGYALHWAWTGFEGNTLWDWLKMLLLPVIFPTVLLPAAVAGIMAGAADADPARSAAAEKDAAAVSGATPGAPSRAQAGAAAVIPGGTGSRAVLGALGALALAAVVSPLVLADHTPGSAEPPAAATAAPPARAASACEPGGGQLVLADAGIRVVLAHSAYFACHRRDAPVALGQIAAGSKPGTFTVAGSRLVYADQRCGAPQRCATDIKVLRQGSRRAPFVRAHFARTGGVAGLHVSRGGALAVMLRGACSPGGTCADPQLVLMDARGRRTVAQGPALDVDSLAGRATTVYWREDGGASSATLSR
jgi:hypothetical protein